jgi:hypothetical protein
MDLTRPFRIRQCRRHGAKPAQGGAIEASAPDRATLGKYPSPPIKPNEVALNRPVMPTPSGFYINAPTADPGLRDRPRGAANRSTLGWVTRIPLELKKCNHVHNAV